VIDLSEDDPQLLVRLFQWVYSNEYALRNDEIVKAGLDTVAEACEKGWKGDKNDFEPLMWEDTICMLHLNMYAMADYFMMKDLAKYALNKLRTAVAMTFHLDHVFECIESLETFQNSSQEQVNQVVASLAAGLSRRGETVVWTAGQVDKIRELAKDFPKMKELVERQDDRQYLTTGGLPNRPSWW
jgi:hypothetical protein